MAAKKKSAAKKPAKNKQRVTEYTMSKDGMNVTARKRQLAGVNKQGQGLYFTGKAQPKRYR
jgi:hypothetical protein